MSIPESLTYKKHNWVNYCSVCKTFAEDILRVRKEDGETNLVDLLRKVMTGQKRWDLFYHILLRIGSKYWKLWI